MINYPRSDKTGIAKLLPSWKFLMGLMLAGIVVGAGLFAIAVYIFPVPQPNDVAVAETTKVMYADGKGEIGRLGDVRRTSVPLADVPVHVQHAVLAAEDRTFYDHGGFSPEGIARAFVNNVTGGSTQGGSTITQQYVKNAFLTQDQSFVRKGKELVLSVKLETIESKDEILENYLNTIYFGRGAYGIQAAAEAYYGKSVKKLTLSEGAALAGMIQSPGNFEPELFKDRLVDRWFYVLDGMVEKDWIGKAEKRTAEFPKFRKQSRANQLSGQNGYILEAVRREMTQIGWSEAEIDGGGLTITTTIEKKAQEAAVDAVRSEGPQYNKDGVRIGLTAIHPGTGEIMAIYGGEDYLDDQLDNALQARAQGGSTFKAFTLAAALEEGVGLDSVWNGSSPATINGYTLQNAGNSSYGSVSLLTATTNSINTAYVAVESEVGVKDSMDAAERLGLPKDTPGLEDNLTFVLGSASPRAVDMASAFSTFASRGIHADPTILKKVERSNGEVAYRLDPNRGKRAFDEETMDTVNFALQTVVNSGTGTRASWTGRPVAGKTGTTDGSKSAWFVGYTPQMAAAVMMMKADKKGRPVSLDGVGGLSSVYGGTFPAGIWAAFADAALDGEPVESFVAPGSGGVAGGGQQYYTPPPAPAPAPDATTSPESSPKSESSSGGQSEKTTDPTPPAAGSAPPAPSAPDQPAAGAPQQQAVPAPQ